jgi:Zn-dependent protease with chaperone function/uncharacterized tellurite resistance protein B-like protein
MTTQFFARQDAARTNTVWLVVLFTLAVVGLVGVTSSIDYTIAAMINAQPSAPSRSGGGPGSGQVGDDIDPFALAAIIGAATAIVILLGSLYQVTALRLGGGTRVAESVGGRQISGDTGDPAERRLMNIVEEMAIASGTPVPPVYLMEESAINAFAAGYLPGDAVIGVTRGAIDNLNRDQLQGVVAHEFSHILNGDMRMNIRMIGILHGILLLGLIGHILLRSIHFMGRGSRSSGDNKGSAGIIMAMVGSGLALIIIGGIGSFIGGLIKAAVSRQREYLADASAVQFTRNPSGIAGALKRIGGLSSHGRLKHPNAGIASHMYFAQGIYEGFTGLLATHPPLEKRIRAIEPSWDGGLPAVAGGDDAPGPMAGYRTAGGASGFAGDAPPLPVGRPDIAPQTRSPRPAISAAKTPDGPTEVPVSVVMAATDQVGSPESSHRSYTAELLRRLDPELSAAARESYSARALVLALLLDDDAEIRQTQFDSLGRMLPPDIVLLTGKLAAKVDRIPDATRLPLVDLALPMLRMMTAPQYATFAKAFEAMVKADHRLTIFEWTLSQVLMRHLRQQYVPIPSTVTLHYRLGRLGEEISVLLSTLARVGHQTDDVERAFAAGAAKLPTVNLRVLPAKDCSFTAVERGIEKLARASVHRRGEVLVACAATVCADGVVKVKEAELLRGIADLLDCPMPPLVGKVESE